MAKFPQYRPDAPDYDDGTLTGLVTCSNVYPSPGGYKPFKGLVAATGTIPAAWVGGGAFEYNGNTGMVGATAAALYSHASGAWTSRYAIVTSSPWYFAQFGDIVIGVNGNTPVKYTLSTSAGALLGGTPPSGATQIAIVRGFVVVSGISSAAQTVYWSGLETAEGWTVGTNQCDTQIVPDGGPITGLSGGEYGVVFQASAISIMEYVGVPNIFTFRKVEDSIGCVAHGSIARDERMHFFLSRKGFKAWSPESGVAHIGQNAIDTTFLASYTTSQIQASLRCTVDPERRLVIWSMPDRLWIYNIEIDSWSVVDISGLVGLASGFTGSAATLESIAVTYPSLEDVTPSLDDAFWNGGGKPLLLLIKTDGIGYTFSSGANLAATFKTQKMELFPNMVAHIRNSRLITDATSGVTVNIDTAARPGDSQTRFTGSTMQANSDIPLRASGKVVQAEIAIAAGATWTYAKGYELEASPGGRL